MKAYILRLLSVSLLSTVCNYLLPKGNVRKFVTPLLSLAVTASVILPCLSLFRGNGEALSALLPKTEAVSADYTYENAVEAEYARRLAASIESRGEVEASVFLGEDFSISHIVLSGDVTTGVMAYITMELEVPRSFVEIR